MQIEFCFDVFRHLRPFTISSTLVPTYKYTLTQHHICFTHFYEYLLEAEFQKISKNHHYTSLVSNVVWYGDAIDVSPQLFSKPQDKLGPKALSES